MKRVILLPLLAFLGILAGCHNPNPSATTADSVTNAASMTNGDSFYNAFFTAPEPTQAQPKLRTMKLYIGAETLEAELALTPMQERTGMMFRTNILETDAMLFTLPQPQQASFWMKNCPESISAAYITRDGVIQEIHHLEQNDTNSVVAARDDIQFVLETKEGWFTRHNIPVGTAIQSEKGPLADVFLRRQ